MTLYPEVQAAAHAEIDRVIGRDRVPSFEDRDKTPYIKAMIQECLRWNPAGPIGGCLGDPKTGTCSDIAADELAVHHFRCAAQINGR